MNIYLVKLKSESRYTPDSFIAVAASTEQALSIHPSYYKGGHTPVNFDAEMEKLWAIESSDRSMDRQWTTDRNDIVVTYLGQAAIDFTGPTIIEMWYGYC